MSGPVVNVADLEGRPMAPPGGSDRFGAEIASFSESIGLKRLGAMFITVEPGKRAFPFHNHLANDEMFVILEGTGTYRYGDTDYPLKAGDVCGAPRGGEDTAHQIINTGDKPLKYIGISTRLEPEVVEYPDSGKFSTLAIWPGEDFWHAHVRVIGRKTETLDYWDGEDV